MCPVLNNHPYGPSPRSLGQKLLQVIRDIDPRYPDYSHALDLIADGAALDEVDPDGNTALIMAAWKGHAPVVRALMAKGADAEAADNDGMTALMTAAAYHPDCAQVIMEWHVDAHRRDNLGWDAAKHASQHGNSHIADVIRRYAVEHAAPARRGPTHIPPADAATLRRVPGQQRSRIVPRRKDTP